MNNFCTFFLPRIEPYLLTSSSSCYLGKSRKRSLLSVRYSVLKKRYPKDFCRGRPVGPTTCSLRLVSLGCDFQARRAWGSRPLLARPPKIQPNQSGRHGQSIPQGCALKFFWFFLFTTDAASEGNANVVCQLPSGEEENERSEVKKNSTLLSDNKGIKKAFKNCANRQQSSSSK